MKIKAILFDILVPVFAYFLGIVTTIFGVIALAGSMENDRTNRKIRQVAYSDYHGRGD